MERPKRERLKEFYKRLKAAPPASTWTEAYDLIVRAMNSVENDMTSIPYDPTKWQSDGRLYPPMLDNMRPVENHPKVRRFRSVAHNTFLGDNGAIQIQTLDKKIQLDKKGFDGKGVWEE